jgi:hypothetical protein
VISVRKLVFAMAVLVVGLASVAAFLWQRLRSEVKFNTPYQAVLLDDNQVYYGKLEGVGTAYPVLLDVYYVKSAVDPNTKAVKSMLVRRGKEWHAPDRMYLNARHIILIEPVSPNSQVAQLIAESKGQ